MKNWKVVWITGASTGIGKEIAQELAKAGVKIAASARSHEKLKQLGPHIHPYPVDVTNADAVKKTVEKIEAELGPIDLAIFGAGTYTPQNASQFDLAQFEQMMRTNYFGVVNCIAALLPNMQLRKAGHLAWIASVAGYVGLPNAAAYGPSKAALINLAESLKPELELQNINISVINPGFVATPMTAKNEFPMPFIMQPAEAAHRTINGLAKRKFEIAYPSRFVWILKFLRLLPYNVFFWIITKTTL
jgi:short-subunit dehydrogenase